MYNNNGRIYIRNDKVVFEKKKKVSKLFIDSKSSKHYYNNIFVCYCTKGFVLLRFTINNIKYEFEETKVLKYK